jgi:hypothetical protein
MAKPRYLTCIAFLPGLLAGGTIQGVVLEQASGRPLTRSIVRLDPVPTAGGARPPALTTRAGRSGQFVFPAVAPGSYLLVALRDGYFPAAYGQRVPIGRGTPIQVTADSDLFAELRLRHKGALTGRVLDENGVARAGVSVLAYRARLPLRSAGSAVSDDRGVFRVHGLEPGKYWARSAGHTLDDGSGWLPTSVRRLGRYATPVYTRSLWTPIHPTLTSAPSPGRYSASAVRSPAMWLVRSS